MIFLFLYLTLNLLKEISLPINFTIYCYILHFQFLTSILVLFLTSDELESLFNCILYNCCHRHMLVCMHFIHVYICMHIHTYMYITYMHLYTLTTHIGLQINPHSYRCFVEFMWSATNMLAWPFFLLNKEPDLPLATPGTL